jgi:hypothetical protein
MSILILGMRGLGDNIIQRAFVKTLSHEHQLVYLRTPWPELYEDIDGVRFVRDESGLRTQRKNVARQPAGRWCTPPAGLAQRRISYGAALSKQQTMLDGFERTFGTRPSTFDLPPTPMTLHEAARPIALVRPVTERREWPSAARSPLPEYITEIATELMADHFVVSVADLADGEEWLVGDAPPAHMHLHHGELSVLELLGLVRIASVVVGGVGWIVPACVAAGTPLFCVLGGHGGHNGPERLIDPRMDARHVGFATPDHFCLCDRMQHRCDKRISDLSRQWAAFRRQSHRALAREHGADVDR